MAKPHEFAHHPPADEPREPEAARKRGVAAGAAAERATEAEVDAAAKKIGVPAMRVIAVSGKR